MWIEVRVRRKRSGIGQTWIIRYGRRHIRLSWAWSLGWEHYQRRSLARVRGTRDGWLAYFDAGKLHLKVQMHRWRPCAAPRRPETMVETYARIVREARGRHD